MRSNKPLIIFLLVFGLIFLISGVANFFYTYNLISNGVVVEGTVLKMAHRYSRRGGPTYEPLILYKSSDGKEYKMRSNFFSSDSAAYKKGDKIAVCYNPKNPEDVTIADENEYLLPLFVAGGMGLIMFWGGIAVYRKDKKKKLPSSSPAP